MNPKDRYQVKTVNYDEYGWPEEIQLLDFKRGKVLFLYIAETAIEDMTDDDRQETLKGI